MPVTLSQLQLAFMAADMDPDSEAWIHADTGKFVFSTSSLSDNEGGGPPPEDEPGWHQVPNGHDLDLKRRLVHRFVWDECPALDDEVQRCFTSKGAWRRYKDLLIQRGLIDRWHRFQNEATDEALLEWAKEEGLVVIAEPRPEVG